MTDQDVGKQHSTYFLHIQYFLFRSHSCINGPGFVLVHYVTSAPLKCPVTCRRVYLYYVFAPVHLLPVWGKVDFTLGVLALVIHLHFLCVNYVACKMKKKKKQKTYSHDVMSDVCRCCLTLHSITDTDYYFYLTNDL